MQAEKELEKIKKIQGYFEDDLSKEIFEWKIKERLYECSDQFYNRLYKIYNTSTVPRFTDFMQGRRNKIAITGAGLKGLQAYQALTHAGYEISCFLDNSLEKQKKELVKGIPTISFGEFCALHREEIAVISNPDYGLEFYSQLVELGFPQSNIYYSLEGYIRTMFGNIYFDLPELIKSGEEVFIDAGGANGDTTLEFMEWCNHDYEKVYAFEPTKDGYFVMQEKFRSNPKVEVFPYGLWNKDTSLKFHTGSNIVGSRITDLGNDTIEVKSLDNILQGRKATFIKMDIEGSELEALMGAKDTIQRYRPKLAISLYHKPEDIITIPSYIKELIPDYKLYLRHHSNTKWDFVLYAI